MLTICQQNNKTSERIIKSSFQRVASFQPHEIIVLYVSLELLLIQYIC